MISLTRQQWTAATAGQLRAVLFGAENQLKSEVEKGISELWQLGGDASGLVITRVEQSNPVEFVIVAGVGSGLGPFLKHCMAVCNRQGWILRLHTRKRAMVRACERLGMSVSERRPEEIVLRYGEIRGAA